MLTLRLMKLKTMTIFHVHSSEDAHILIKMLLDNFIKHEECPPELLGKPEESVGLLYGLGAAVAGQKQNLRHFKIKNNQMKNGICYCYYM